MKKQHITRYILAILRGDYTLGKPLPIRASAGDLQVIPLAEVAAEAIDSRPQYYSLQKLADASGVSISTIKREVSSRRLKTFKLRGRRMVSLEDAMKYWDALRVCAERLEEEQGSGADDPLTSTE